MYLKNQGAEGSRSGKSLVLHGKTFVEKPRGLVEPSDTLARMFLQRATLGRNQWWWYLITLIIVVFGATAGSLLLVPVAERIAYRNGLGSKLFEFYNSTDYRLIGMEPWVFMLLMLVPFMLVLVLYFVATTQIQKKPLLATVTARPRFDWKRLGYGFGIWLGLTIVFELLHYLIHPELYSFDFRPERFFPVLIVAALLLPLQVAAEEIITRGYILQGIGLLANNRWIPLVVSAVLFGLLHFANPETAAFGFLPAMYGYVVMGLFLGFITLMDDGLELAIGVHYANNLYAATITTYPAAALPLPALFSISELNIWIANVVVTLAALAFVALAVRRYGWRMRTVGTYFTQPLFTRNPTP